MKKLSTKAVTVLLSGLLLFSVLCFGACQSGVTDDIPEKESIQEDKSDTGTSYTRTEEAEQAKTEKHEEKSSPKEETKNAQSHEHGKDAEHKPCPSNFVVQPEEGDELNQVVSEKKTPGNPSSPVTRIVYITTTQACACTMKRCEETDKLIEEMKTKYNDLPLESINYSEETDKARKLAKKYKTIMLPIILFLNEEGGPLVKMSGEIDGEKAANEFDRYFKSDAK